MELAQRCASFLAVDASSAALTHAARRLEHLPAARTRHLTVPQDWPDGRFDLIVVSEVGYYLAPGELAELFERVEAALLPGGTLALCHWRHPSPAGSSTATPSTPPPAASSAGPTQACTGNATSSWRS